MKKLAILLAAGKGRRMGLDTLKQYIKVQGRALFLHSLQTFLESGVDEIALVVTRGDEDYVREQVLALNPQKPIRIISGGEERFLSVYRALCEYREQDIDIVTIHDSARPAISRSVIEQSLEDAKRYGACVVAVPSKDTVKIANAEGFVEETPKREVVYIVQTPQSFEYPMLLAAYDTLMSDTSLQTEITDDAMVVERILHKAVKITMGEYDNIKVTTKEDISLIEWYLSKRERI